MRNISLFIIMTSVAICSFGCAKNKPIIFDNMSDVVTIEDSEVPLYAKPVSSIVKVPQASGIETYKSGKAVIDASHTADGYVMLKYDGAKEKIKVQITKGSVSYTYDLNASGKYETFPFSEGNGIYLIKIFENISGKQYAQVMSKDLTVSMTDLFSPFLTPNQYVNFTESSETVKIGAQLALNSEDAIGIVTNVFNYVTKNIKYDTEKAASVQSGYLPDVDTVLTLKKGICFDYAALMTAMLRSQNIPTKLVVGYSGGLYHAWVSVYIDSIGWVDNFIYFDGQEWSLMDPTFASSGMTDEMKKYVGDGTNYQAKYSY